MKFPQNCCIYELRLNYTLLLLSSTEINKKVTKLSFLYVARKVLHAYSSSYNLTPPISQVLIGRYLIFYSLTSPMCCNSPRKCTPLKYKARQNAGFPIVT